MRTKRFTTEQERFDTVARFLKSHQTQASWCKENSVAVSTLYRWLQEYKKNQKEVKFVPLDIKHIKSVDTPTKKVIAANTILIEIGACKIHMSEHTAIPLIIQLMKEVNNCSV